LPCRSPWGLGCFRSSARLWAAPRHVLPDRPVPGRWAPAPHPPAPHPCRPTLAGALKPGVPLGRATSNQSSVSETSDFDFGGDDPFAALAAPTRVSASPTPSPLGQAGPPAAAAAAPRQSPAKPSTLAPPPLPPKSPGMMVRSSCGRSCTRPLHPPPAPPPARW
jgi:hypothetical protein